MSESAFDNQPHDGSVRDNLRYYARALKRQPLFRAWNESSRNVRRFVPHMWRLATHEFRQLPSAIIAGTMKSGTTQLFAYLIRHPRLFPPCHKEIDYFSRHSDKSLEWYRSRFPLRRQMRAVAGQALEASPSYMSMPAALPKMHAVLPDARIIAVLRDPVARAFSHYQHYKTRHKEHRSFEDAIDDELRQNNIPAEFGAALGPVAPSFESYLARGYYALQLEPLLQLYSRERVLILDSADLFADTNGVCQRAFEFLGVEPFDVQPGKVYNRGYYNETIEPTVAHCLREHYRPYDELLVRLIGHPCSWMTSRRAQAA